MASVIKENKIQDVDDNEVDYEMISPSRVVGANASLVPMSSNSQSTRLFYAAKFVEQAMPLATREAPLVQALDPESEDGKSFEQEFGRKMGARFFDNADEGTVTEVTPDSIKVKGSDGKDYETPIYNNFQFNRKTYLTNKPLVKVGDKVKRGQILAGSNFTDDEGTMAQGVNARIAMVPYKGFSMDDAIVVSESFANRLRSMHNYQHELAKDDQTKFGKTHYHSLFPTKFTKDQLANLDDNGMAKPGTVLKKGDPIMLATKPKPVYSNSEHLGRLGKVFRSVRADASEVWEHDYPGYVVDTVDGKKAHKVYVSAEVPAAIGDKLTIRNGQKCYHPDTEVLTEAGWKKIGDITTEDKVAALFDRNEGKTKQEFGVSRVDNIPQDFYARFVHPIDTTTHAFDGELFCFENSAAAYAVTGNHRVWSRVYGSTRFKAVWAAKIHQTQRHFMDAAVFDLSGRTTPEYIDLEYCHSANRRPCDKSSNHSRYRTDLFVKFLAFYLRSGSVNKALGYGIRVTPPAAFRKDFEETIIEMGLSWRPYRGIGYIVGPDKTLSLYLRQFGSKADKFIPEWVFTLPKEHLEAFIVRIGKWSVVKGDGAVFRFTGKKLIEGIQRILIMLGYRTRCSVKRRAVGDRRAIYTLTRYKGVKYIYADERRVPHSYYTMHYEGPVHCCQVPGCGVILTRLHDKIMWNGNSIISKIIPDKDMLMDKDGKPFEVLLNPLALPSRVNTATLYEMMVGKVARKKGHPIAMAAYMKDGESRLEQVKKMLADEGLTDTEEVFDPVLNRKLENPISTGEAFIMKLHHVVESKKSARGNAGYDQNKQPLKGGSDAAQSKRLGGLETTALMAKGAYNVLRDASTIRGSENNDYWRAIRQGYKPAEPGAPFVWEKFRVLLNGAGFNTKDLGKGKLRLSPMTDKDLDEKDPIELKNGKMVKADTLEPEEGGLFDPRMVALNKWGKITLPHGLPNPAFENQIATLLGVKLTDLRRVLAGEVALEEVRKK